MADRAGNEARCQVPNHTRDGVCPEHFSYCSHEYEGVCGQPLVQDGACQTCGGLFPREAWVHGDDESGLDAEALTLLHPYAPAKGCPVHGVPAKVEEQMPGDLRLSDAEAARLTAAWNDGGPLTPAAALYALHIANDALSWNQPVAKMIVTTALRRSLPAPAGVPATKEGGA